MQISQESNFDFLQTVTEFSLNLLPTIVFFELNFTKLLSTSSVFHFKLFIASADIWNALQSIAVKHKQRARSDKDNQLLCHT